jgi:hypothetical protein
MEEEDLPFSIRFQPFCDATKTNSDFCSRMLQTIQAPKDKRTPKQAYQKMQLRVFFFFEDKKYFSTALQTSRLRQVSHRLKLYQEISPKNFA